MHASTRILLLLVAGVAIVGGWWILLALNSVVAALALGLLWTVIVLIATRVLFAVGFRYNRSTGGRSTDKAATADAGTALADLARLRDQGLISADEYASKRARILERM